MLPDTPLILLPGVCCDAWFFRHQAQAFARTQNGTPRHVIVPEWIAHVDPRDGTGAMRRLAARLSTAWHEAGLDGSIVVGHSMGGFIATLACATGRFRPGGLLIIDSSLPVPADRRTALLELGARVIGCDDPDPTERLSRMESVIGNFVRSQLTGASDDREIIDEIVERMSRADPQRNGIMLQSAAALDIVPSLERVPGRVAALAAEPGRLPIELFQAARPDAEVALLHDVGHFLPIFAAEQVNTAIACMLGGRPLRGAGMEPVIHLRAPAA
ncbi:MAG: alpha/beta hydrolase [Phycisphaeraceae bacterium]|nr:alpha/beta hydrolase [Phycisphaeraceae bacterium]